MDLYFNALLFLAECMWKNLQSPVNSYKSGMQLEYAVQMGRKVGMHAREQLDWGTFRLCNSPTGSTVSVRRCLRVFLVVENGMLCVCRKSPYAGSDQVVLAVRLERGQWHVKHLTAATQ